MSRPITPAERQWLNLISFAEGTWNPKSGPQYNMMFSGKRFNNLSRHPDVVNRGGGYASSAAGAYQFLTPTWGGVSKKLGLKDFGPQAQDLGALQLIRQRGVDPARDPITPQTVAKLAPEWASLPTMQGRSYYGQPVKKFETLVNFVRQQGGKVPQGGTLTQVSSETPFGGSAPANASQEERLVAESLGRLLLDKVLGQVLTPAGKLNPTQLTPPPLPTAEDETSLDEQDPGLLEQLGERLGGIEKALSGAFQANPVSEALKVKDRMQQLIRSAQEAFKPGTAVF
jgi:muramidase (phage lysozyme)